MVKLAVPLLIHSFPTLPLLASLILIRQSFNVLALRPPCPSSDSKEQSRMHFRNAFRRVACNIYILVYIYIFIRTIEPK